MPLVSLPFLRPIFQIVCWPEVSGGKQSHIKACYYYGSIVVVQRKVIILLWLELIWPLAVCGQTGKNKILPDKLFKTSVCHVIDELGIPNNACSLNLKDFFPLRKIPHIISFEVMIISPIFSKSNTTTNKQILTEWKQDEWHWENVCT